MTKPTDDGPDDDIVLEVRRAVAQSLNGLANALAISVPKGGDPVQVRTAFIAGITNYLIDMIVHDPEPKMLAEVCADYIGESVAKAVERAKPPPAVLH